MYVEYEEKEIILEITSSYNIKYSSVMYDEIIYEGLISLFSLCNNFSYFIKIKSFLMDFFSPSCLFIFFILYSASLN